MKNFLDDPKGLRWAILISLTIIIVGIIFASIASATTESVATTKKGPITFEAAYIMAKEERSAPAYVPVGGIFVPLSDGGPHYIYVKRGDGVLKVKTSLEKTLLLKKGDILMITEKTDGLGSKRYYF